MVTYLIELMRRFELCFPVGEEDEKHLLVPELLSRFQPILVRSGFPPPPRRRPSPQHRPPRMENRSFPEYYSARKSGPRWLGLLRIDVRTGFYKALLLSSNQANTSFGDIANVIIAASEYPSRSVWIFDGEFVWMLLIPLERCVSTVRLNI